MTGIIGGILREDTVMKVAPGVTDKDAQAAGETMRVIHDLVGKEGLQSLLVRATRIDRIANTERIDPLNNGVPYMEIKGIHVEEQPFAQKAAAYAKLIVDAVFRLQRRSDHPLAIYKLR